MVKGRPNIQTPLYMKKFGYTTYYIKRVTTSWTYSIMDIITTPHHPTNIKVKRSLVRLSQYTHHIYIGQDFLDIMYLCHIVKCRGDRSTDLFWDVGRDVSAQVGGYTSGVQAVHAYTATYSITLLLLLCVQEVLINFIQQVTIQFG